MNEERTHPVPEWSLSTQQAQLLMLSSLWQIQSDLDVLTKEVKALQKAVTGENAEDALNARTIYVLNRKVDNLQGQLKQAEVLLESAKAGEAGALAELETVLVGVREATEALRADNPPA